MRAELRTSGALGSHLGGSHVALVWPVSEGDSRDWPARRTRVSASACRQTNTSAVPQVRLDHSQMKLVDL